MSFFNRAAFDHLTIHPGVGGGDDKTEKTNQQSYQVHAERQFIQLNEHRNKRSASPEGQSMSQGSPGVDLNTPPALLPWQRSTCQPGGAKSERACLARKTRKASFRPVSNQSWVAVLLNASFCPAAWITHSICLRGHTEGR